MDLHIKTIDKSITFVRLIFLLGQPVVLSKIESRKEPSWKIKKSII
jgi:hypothetical protein